MQKQEPGGLPGFFGRGRYIVGSRNAWDYMELWRIVKERRRQKVNLRLVYAVRKNPKELVSFYDQAKTQDEKSEMAGWIGGYY